MIKKKVILTEGDSWTAGDIINPTLREEIGGFVNHPKNNSYRLPKVWPHKLGEMLGIEVLNTSNAGCSNDSIVRRVVENTFDLLEKYKGEEIFVIVGWSSPERKDFYFARKRGWQERKQTDTVLKKRTRDELSDNDDNNNNNEPPKKKKKNHIKNRDATKR